jgi:3-isopropylmalate/(R)-2-methylmalate dehydratase large subunit
VATADHNVPTIGINLPIADPISATQVSMLSKNCAEFGVKLYPMADPGQGIVHVIGPELGITQPGMTIVCGDSHTSTHGAFGALALGLGRARSSMCWRRRACPSSDPKTMAITIDGELRPGVTAKDVILAIIGRIGTGGGIGHIVEYRGTAIRSLSIEGRMTVCNMSIEAGAKAGMIAPDDTTFAYLEGRPHAPKGKLWEEALADWRTLPTDPGASFDKEVVLDGAAIRPHVSWGTNPSQVVAIDEFVPDPTTFDDPGDRDAAVRALKYMGLNRARRCATSPSTRCYWLMHQQPDRGSPPGGDGGRRPPGPTGDAGDGGAGLDAGPGASRAGRVGCGLQGRGVRVACSRLLDVPRDEP